MIKQIWTVRNVHKLLNGFVISFSAFMLVYTILNILVLDSTVFARAYFWSNNSKEISKYMLLILPVIQLLLTSTLFYLSNIPKKIKYELNEITKITALKDLKNHRELIIGCNLLYTSALTLLQADALTFSKQLAGFSYIPSLIIVILSIPFIIMKIMKTKKIYEI